MATTKKSSTTTKKPSTPKKRTSTAKTTRTRSTPTKAASAATRTQAKTYDDSPFMTFRITRQTIYWGILCAIVLALALWVVDINDRVMRIYDQIDQTTLEDQEVSIPSVKPTE